MRIALPVLLLLFLLATATIVYKYSGDIVLGFTKDQVVPYVLTTDDVKAGCAMIDAFAPVISSFPLNKSSSYQLAIVFDFFSGSCIEFKAWEEELRYLRAIYANNVAEAQDARINQKRLLNQSAQKQLKAFRNLSFAFKEESGRDCPDLTTAKGDFYWLTGMLGGLKAILNDLSSEGAAKVPLDIAFKVSRGVACLDNQKWWGLPKAIQATVWASFPSNKPAEVEPLSMLEQSIQTGLSKGMRLPQILAAQVYIGLGNVEQIKNIIRNDVKRIPRFIPNPEFRFLDAVVTLQLQAISDRLWTEKIGKRTPIGGMGRFSDDPKNTVDTIDIKDIL